MGTATKIVNNITGRSAEKAYSDAADIQSDATKYAADLAYKQYRESKETLSPWVTAGSNALTNLSSALRKGGRLYDTSFTASDFEKFKDPSYEWRLKQGQNALASQAAAAGNYGSGNMGTALVDYGQNAAAQEYSNAYNRYMNSQNTLFDRLYNMSSMGANAGSGLATLGANSAAAQGDYATQGANALASGLINSTMASTNAMNSLLNQGMSMLPFLFL